MSFFAFFSMLLLLRRRHLRWYQPHKAICDRLNKAERKITFISRRATARPGQLKWKITHMRVCEISDICGRYTAPLNQNIGTYNNETGRNNKSHIYYTHFHVGFRSNEVFQDSVPLKPHYTHTSCVCVRAGCEANELLLIAISFYRIISIQPKYVRRFEWQMIWQLIDTCTFDALASFELETATKDAKCYSWYECCVPHVDADNNGMRVF